MEKAQKRQDKFIPYEGPSFKVDEMKKRSNSFYEYMNMRRSLRNFSAKTFPIEILENIIKTASTAPSGANKQPWTFCIVQDQNIKKKLREAAEKEEYQNYHGRMSEEWLNELEKFDTDWHKEFIEIAPYLVVVFKKTYDLEEAEKKKNYYVNESVGLACGFLLAAIHNAGLVALTHTPSPMNFLSQLLERPENEKPFLLIPVGYPSEIAEVPDIKRKKLEQISKIY